MLKSMVKISPNFLEDAVRNLYYSIPDKLRYGKVYRDNFNLLKESQYWTKIELEEYQVRELKKIIRHSFETVPYYNKLFKESGIKPSDIKDFRDLKKIPYLTKEIIQNNLDELISSKYKREKLQYITTGGSTGIPMGFYIDRKFDTAREWAFITHMWSRVGYDINKTNRTVYLRGNSPKSGFFEYRNKSLVLSSYNLKESNMKKYVELIEEYKPSFIQAYPSSISILSDYINNNGIDVKLPSLKAIICASENIYDFQKKSIEKAFNVRVYSFYGLTEHTCIGGGCEHSNNYHIQSEYGYTELINEDGKDVEKEEELGEIVATGFNNYVMPFIRYRTADIAVNTNEICECGRGYKLIKRVEGRKQEQLITSDGSRVAMTSIIFAQHFKAFGKMKNIQLEQNEIGKITVKIVEKEKFKQEDINEVINKMESACSGNLNVKIKFVDTIARTARGKHRFLIQNLKL
ncbi:phenylacetate--CoA ligase family protein [Peribacillus butanolivorans]|uniref:phenylacetate--CoA ligase family protein n=1 Tax=Peribacillus butanolivorans TaxID=421767 RepID=UPI0036DC8FC4